MKEVYVLMYQYESNVYDVPRLVFPSLEALLELYPDAIDGDTAGSDEGYQYFKRGIEV